MNKVRAIAALLIAVGLLAACTNPTPQPSTSAPEPTTTPSPTPTPTPEPTLAWGPTEADLAAAMTQAAALTDEQAAGQVIVARYSGVDPARAADLVTQFNLAGVILFSENVESLEQVQATAAAVQSAVAATRNWPAIVSTDNEGGLVQRLSGDSGPWTTFPPFQAAGAASLSPEAVSAAYQGMAGELLASGINTDFAPDADVTVGPSDVTIGDRSAGSDPARVADTVTAALQGFAAGGVLTSIKHFPGHGSLNVDSHQTLPVQDRPIAELAADDLVPFAAGVDAGAPMVMVGHIAVTEWDPGVPASLSPAAYAYLRDTLGFTGVAVTDGLDMGALTSSYTSGQIASMALIAGADLLLSPTDIEGARDGILAALADGTLTRDRLTQAAGRVIAMMQWQARLAQTAPAVTMGSAATGLAQLAAASVTVVAGACSGPLAGPRIHLYGGTDAAWQAFVDAATAAGLQVVPLEQEADSDVRLLTDSGGGAADVAIAIDSPTVLANASAPTLLATYSDTPQAMAAAAAVVAGTAPAPGQLPVAVGDLPATACP